MDQQHFKWQKKQDLNQNRNMNHNRLKIFEGILEFSLRPIVKTTCQFCLFIVGNSFFELAFYSHIASETQKTSTIDRISLKISLISKLFCFRISKLQVSFVEQVFTEHHWNFSGENAWIVFTKLWFFLSRIFSKVHVNFIYLQKRHSENPNSEKLDNLQQKNKSYILIFIRISSIVLIVVVKVILKVVHLIDFNVGLFFVRRFILLLDLFVYL